MSQGPELDKYKLISFNILNGFSKDSGEKYPTKNRAQWTADEALILLNRRQADFICFQELSFVHFTQLEWEKKVREILGMPYICYGNAIPKQRRFFGQCTCSKWPFQKTAIIPLQQFQGEGRCALVSEINDTLVLINTHLDVWDRSEATRQKQIQEIEMFLQSQKLGHQITLLVGDFNTVRRKDYPSEPIWWEAQYPNERERDQKIGSSSLSYLENKMGALEVFDILGCYPGATKTKETDKPHRRIDYIWIISPYKKAKIQYQVFQAKVLDSITLSDHYPVEVAFGICSVRR